MTCPLCLADELETDVEVFTLGTLVGDSANRRGMEVSSILCAMHEAAYVRAMVVIAPKLLEYAAMSLTPDALAEITAEVVSVQEELKLHDADVAKQRKRRMQ